MLQFNNMEIELKYKIDSAEQYDRILNDAWVRQLAGAGEAESLRVKAAYFDTIDGVLTRNDIAFRIRSEGDRVVGTLKWRDSDEGIRGLFVRNEINVPIADGTCLLAPNPGIFMESPEGKDLLDVLDGKPLANIFDVVFTRKRWRLDFGESIMELALDEGVIAAHGETLPIREAEVELFSGSKDDLLDFGKKLADKYSLEPELRTKFARGVELSRGEPSSGDSGAAS
jgi:triphosphatase